MASQGQPTRVRSAEPPPPSPAADSGVDLTTLFLSAIASAAAAYITSKIWARGTLISAAMTPVIVALVKEGLRKPTEKVANVVPGVVAAPSRWTRTGPDEPGLVREQPAPPPDRVDPDAPQVVLPPVVAADHGPVNVYSTRARRLRWRVAVITGLLGFGICVVLFTIPELISGKSIGRGSGDATTIFGGSKHHGSKGTTSTTKTTSTTSTTATDETNTTPERTTTTEQPSTAAPAPNTATPSSTTPGAPSSAAPATPSTATPGATAAPQQQDAPTP